MIAKMSDGQWSSRGFRSGQMIFARTPGPRILWGNKVGKHLPAGARVALALVLSTGPIASMPAHAGGFYLQEQSPKEVGRAFSGEAASADGPSTIFFNPAGMTALPGIQLSSGGTLLLVDARQSNRGSTRTASGLATPVAISGGDGGNPFATAIPVPSFYASAHVDGSPLWLGLGVSAPFGLKLDYASDFFGRYDSLHTKLATYDVQPSAALRLSDALSIGGGIDIQYATVTLTNALPNLSPLSPDGFYRVSGKDWSMGWNAGILARLGRARLGLHYRSRMSHDLEGSQTISGLLGPLAAANGTQPISAPLHLPDIVTASLAYSIGPDTRLMATGRFYNWSVFKRIEIVPAAGSPLVKQLNYRDSWSVALGAERDLSARLTLRAGAMFDRTPVNPSYLTTRVPDGDRTWMTAGATYNLSPHLALNASYAHVFVANSHMDRTDSFYGGLVDVTTRSLGSGHVDMIATTAIARF